MTEMSSVTKYWRGLNQRCVRFKEASRVNHKIDEGNYCLLGKGAAVLAVLRICVRNYCDGSTHTRITEYDVFNNLSYLYVVSV